MTLSNKIEKWLPIVLISVFVIVYAPLALLDKWANEHTLPVTHIEILENNMAHYVRTYPKRGEFISYVSKYNARNAVDIVDSVVLFSYYNDLSPKLVLAVGAAESSFNINAKSYVGARGLLQVMPFWKKELGAMDDNLYDLQVNIKYGTAILKLYIEKENNLMHALAAYNGTKSHMKYPIKIMSQAVWTF